MSKPKEDGESLTSILNEDQRGDLTLLVAGAMFAMRGTVISSFDAKMGSTQNLEHGKVADDKIKSASTNPATRDSAKLKAERKLEEQRVKELSAPHMQELKIALLKHFDEWRTRVVERIGDIVTSKQAAKDNAAKVKVPASKEYAPPDIEINPVSVKSSSESDQFALTKLFPPIETSLLKLPEKSRALIVHSILLILLSLEHYEAPSRVLLLYLCSSLRVSSEFLDEDEQKVAQGLLEAAKEMSGEAETQKKVDENKNARRWKVGLASVAGAALIGVTGGLAAPLVAAGFGTAMGALGLGATATAGYLGAVAGSSVIVGGLFGAYGGRMTGRVMDEYAREVEDFAFLPIRKSHAATKAVEDEKVAHPEKDQAKDVAASDPSERRLKVTVGINGWLTSKEDAVGPWQVLGQASEVFALRWEDDALISLGHSLHSMVYSAAWQVAKEEIIKKTILAEMFAAALWPITLMKIAHVVDNPFFIAKSRADKAGEVLADALINRAQGERPVTLIGYSLGARVIFSCLKSLARRRAFGLIESAVLMGSPTPATTGDWRILRSAVSGRLVNVFSTNDYVLGFLYRTSSMQYGVAGLQKIEGIPSVENVDVSETVNGHLRYRYLVGSILEKIGYDDIDPTAVDLEKRAFKQLQEVEQKESAANKAKASEQHSDNPDAEAQRIEQEVRNKTQQGLAGSGADKLSSKLEGLHAETSKGSAGDAKK